MTLAEALKKCGRACSAVTVLLSRALWSSSACSRYSHRGFWMDVSRAPPPRLHVTWITVDLLIVKPFTSTFRRSYQIQSGVGNISGHSQPHSLGPGVAAKGCSFLPWVHYGYLASQMVPWGRTSLPEDTDGQNLSGPPTKDQEMVQMGGSYSSLLRSNIRGPLSLEIN